MNMFSKKVPKAFGGKSVWKLVLPNLNVLISKMLFAKLDFDPLTPKIVKQNSQCK